MSFALTTDRIVARAKTVTRRTGWTFLARGDRICAVRKARGLKAGETIERLAILRVLDVRREPLRRLIDDRDYGLAECRREGFSEGPLSQPAAFVEWFAASHRCSVDDDVTRIGFSYERAR